tara:strand:+ start:7299 stop:7571 length:273 start_codon:yes stop_codon:yes gene_type:complete
MAKKVKKENKKEVIKCEHDEECCDEECAEKCTSEEECCCESEAAKQVAEPQPEPRELPKEAGEQTSETKMVGGQMMRVIKVGDKTTYQPL